MNKIDTNIFTLVVSVIIIFSLFMQVFDVRDVHAHSMFNSAEEFYGGYRVQVATAPEFPQIGKPSHLLIRVTDADFNEVDEFMMGIRVLYNGQQVDAIAPELINGAHWDLDYTWKNSGNHIVYIDLYNNKIDSNQNNVLTFTFNMGTQSPFGYIFIIAITVGALCLAVIMGYIFLPHVFKKIMH